MCQEWGVKKGILGGHFGFLFRNMVDNVIHDVMGDVFHPNEDTSKTYLFKILFRI